MKNQYSAAKIPDYMAPDSVIKFISEKTYVIIEGGPSNDKTVMFEKENDDEMPLMGREVYPNPEKDMSVTYGSDGQVLDIKFPSKSSEEKYIAKNTISMSDLLKAESFASKNAKITTLSIKELTQFTPQQAAASGAMTLLHQWGSAPNKLYRVATPTVLRYGTGRATTFNDSVGQKDHKLKKGDVATKQAYDNVRCGIDVHLTMKKKGSSEMLSKPMKKWDCGGMPNAIVDVWKTGVSYWGYTYTSSLSINNVWFVHTQVF